jgi:multidrug transporter EmrE-like cation transporter
MAALTNFPFWIGLFLYGLAFLLYSLALTKLPLNVVHPVLTAGAVASVAILAGIIFKEPFYWNTILGIIFVVIGVILISFRSLS